MTQYNNNSVVTITDVGTGSAALLCTTTYQACCLSTDGSQWYFPNGSAVQRSESLPYYRTRTFLGSGTVRLNRNPGATTTGVFHCDIPDASGDLQSIYVGMYTATTGESCSYVEKLQLCYSKSPLSYSSESLLKYNLNIKHLTLVQM